MGDCPVGVWAWGEFGEESASSCNTRCWIMAGPSNHSFEILLFCSFTTNKQTKCNHHHHHIVLKLIVIPQRRDMSEFMINKQLVNFSSRGRRQKGDLFSHHCDHQGYCQIWIGHHLVFNIVAPSAQPQLDICVIAQFWSLSLRIQSSMNYSHKNYQFISIIHSAAIAYHGTRNQFILWASSIRRRQFWNFS